MKISIITPSFNQGRFIERTIQSVLSQPVPDCEYIIMDGGSADETLSIIDTYRGQLHCTSERDRGQAHAVNKGLKMASGEIIGWLNSDDIYYPHTLPKICEVFATHPDVDVIYGDAYHIDEADAVINVYPTEQWDFKKLTQRCYLSQPAVFFRRRVVEQFGELDERLHYCMDYEYWLRLALGGAKFYYLSDILAGSRLYPDTKTLRAPADATREGVMMLKRTVGRVPAIWLLNDAVCDIKKNTAWRLPQVRYIFSVAARAFYNAFKWNGPWYGGLSCMQLAVLLKNKLN